MTMADTPKNTNDADTFSRIIQVRSLRPVDEHNFSETPSLEEMTAIASMLDVISLRKMRFVGKLSPLGDDGWLLTADLGATVTQQCVVTLHPVRTRIDITVERRFLPQFDENLTTQDVDIPDDDTVERLSAQIDLGEIAIETLALAMPEYPKVEGATLENNDSTPSNAAPIEDEKVKPFAGLAALKEKMEDKG